MRRAVRWAATDGGLSHFDKASGEPRAYGAFRRKLRNYVLDKPVIPMAQAIHAATGLPAKILGVPDRGLLREGAFADVIVLDPDSIRDLATYERPHAYSVGIDYVFVNGKAALAEGQPVTERHGRVLLRPR